MPDSDYSKGVLKPHCLSFTLKHKIALDLFIKTIIFASQIFIDRLKHKIWDVHLNIEKQQR